MERLNSVLNRYCNASIPLLICIPILGSLASGRAMKDNGLLLTQIEGTTILKADQHPSTLSRRNRLFTSEFNEKVQEWDRVLLFSFHRIFNSTIQSQFSLGSQRPPRLSDTGLTNGEDTLRSCVQWPNMSANSHPHKAPGVVRGLLTN